MESSFQKRCLFVGKSLMWSLLLYASVMSVINWNEIKTVFANNDKPTYAVSPAGKQLLPVKVATLPAIASKTKLSYNAVTAFIQLAAHVIPGSY